MNLTDEKIKKELSKFYCLGYEAGFKASIVFLLSTKKESKYDDLIDELIDDLKRQYNTYPMINKISVPKELLDAPFRAPEVGKTKA